MQHEIRPIFSFSCLLPKRERKRGRKDELSALALAPSATDECPLRSGATGSFTSNGRFFFSQIPQMHLFLVKIGKQSGHVIEITLQCAFSGEGGLKARPAAVAEVRARLRDQQLAELGDRDRPAIAFPASAPRHQPRAEQVRPVAASVLE